MRKIRTARFMEDMAGRLDMMAVCPREFHLQRGKRKRVWSGRGGGQQGGRTGLANLGAAPESKRPASAAPSKLSSILLSVGLCSWRVKRPIASKLSDRGW